MNMDEFIDQIGGPRDWGRVFLVTGGTWFFVAAGVMAFSFALPGVMKEWSLSPVQGGALAGKTFFGMLVGALLGGWLGDRWGRRPVSMALGVLGSLAGAWCLFAADPPSLGFWRMVAGFAYGGLGPVLFSYLCDFTPRMNRGRMLVFLEMCWAFGSLGVALWSVSVLSWWGWRGVLGFPVLMGLMVPFFCMIPESPRYLVSRGKEAVLEECYGVISLTMETLPQQNWRELFCGGLRKKTWLLIFLWGVVSFGYYALFLWLPRIFALSGIEVVKARWYTLFVMAAQVPGYLLAAWLVEYWGRVRSLVLFFAGTGVMSLLFLSVHTSLAFLGAALGVGLFCLAAWGVVYAYTPELYPTSLRSSASGVSGASARLAGMGAPVVTGWMLQGHGGVPAVLTLVCLLFLAAAGATLLWGEETRREAID